MATMMIENDISLFQNRHLKNKWNPIVELMRMDRNKIVGTKCDWTIMKIMKHDWQLECNGAVVATLKAKKRFGKLFECSYDNINAEIEYNRANDSSIITDSANHEVIGVLEGTSRLHIEGLGEIIAPANFKYANSTYPLKFIIDFGYVVLNKKEKHLAVTEFNNRTTPVRSSFTLLSDDDGQLSPWLLAVIGQYYAINHAYGTVV